MKAHVLHVYALNLGYAQKLVADIPEARIAEQPAPGMNHPAWIIGHLTGSCDSMAALLGLPRELSEQWRIQFGGKSTPLPNRSLYPSMQELIRSLEQGHDRVAAAFTAATDAQLDAEMPIDRRPRFPKVGDMLVFLLTAHEATHLGQLSAWRRAAGFKSIM